ncbi:CHL4 [Candida theae]|uniref:CHL4 n=1 Tax=Candida theae TaxID=1198502 RepID=A0AAD5BGH6_9ASCO|nr:CHL4 [Candida theae]KAI5961549.1 CHL4 [Candida theae]
MEPTERRTSLPDTYIPKYSVEYLSRSLERLTTESLYQLCLRWTKSQHTQPQLPKDTIYTHQGFCNKLTKDIKALQKNPQTEKSDIIRKIIYEYWSSGLNLLQHAQLDSQLILDDFGDFGWTYSIIKDGDGKEVCSQIDIPSFTKNIVSRVNELYLTHVYVFKHPQLPAHVVRIQVFDLNSRQGLLDSSQPQVSPHAPFLICTPSESPYIFHSEISDDVFHKLILKTIELCLPENDKIPVKLVTSEQKPIQSLASIHALKGNSRLGKSLGVWSQYAHGHVDTGPLGDLDQHSTLQEHFNGGSGSPETKLDEIASLRYQGFITDGHTSNRSSRKRDFSVVESEMVPTRSQFASHTPLQHTEFLIQEPINSNVPSRSNIKLKLFGSDRMGLHMDIL